MGAPRRGINRPWVAHSTLQPLYKLLLLARVWGAGHSPTSLAKGHTRRPCIAALGQSRSAGLTVPGRLPAGSVFAYATPFALPTLTKRQARPGTGLRDPSTPPPPHSS